MPQPQRAVHQKQLIEAWFCKTEHAFTEYRQAVARSLQLLKEVDGQLMPYADGAFVLAQARRARAVALRKFERSMQIFTDLVVRGIPPPDDEGDQAFY